MQAVTYTHTSVPLGDVSCISSDCGQSSSTASRQFTAYCCAGVSGMLSPRAPGSIGGRTDPGKVWKGKKMPGHLGNERKTFKNIWLYKVSDCT